jgi:ABC-type branched-subunit amino acid transport system ATPase component
MQENLLVTKNVVKRFGGLTAVKEVSIEVKKGEIFGIIGPNGAGKTTFLNCVSGGRRNYLQRGKYQGASITCSL